MPWYWPFAQSRNSFVNYSIDEPSLIEGISDDTILLCIFTGSLIGLWMYYSTRGRNTAIHPDNQVDIALLRERTQQNDQNNADNQRTRNVGRPRHEMCPICLTESSVLTVETNCGHVFCGQCITSFWKFRADWMSGMKCPVCRQPVTVLLTCFTADEEASMDNPIRQAVVNEINDFNRRFSGAPRTFLEYIYDIPVLVPHILRQIFVIQNLAWTYRLRIIVLFFTVIAYILSPLDILPESVFGILGLFDDLLILFLAALYIVIIYREILSGS